MDSLWMFYLGPFLIWLPRLALGLAVLAGAFFYYRTLRGKTLSLAGVLYRLSLAAVLFRIGYAALLTVTQYVVWNNSDFTRTLLNSPVASTVPLPWHLRLFSGLWESRWGYFTLFSYGRFWLGAVLITCLISAGFWLVLRLIRRFRPQATGAADVAAGLLGALTAGWPGFVVFVPLMFLFSAVALLWLRLKGRQASLDLTGPILAAAGTTLAAGGMLLSFFGLDVLRI